MNTRVFVRLKLAAKKEMYREIIVNDLVSIWRWTRGPTGLPLSLLLLMSNKAKKREGSCASVYSFHVVLTLQNSIVEIILQFISSGSMAEMELQRPRCLHSASPFQ